MILRVFFLFLFLLTLATAADPAAPRSPADERQHHIADQLLAPCCWSESLLVHSSPDARRLRAEIASMIQQGKSDDEIIRQFVATFGERILRDPPGRNQLWLHLLPLVAGLIGLAIVLRWIHHARSASPA